MSRIGKKPIEIPNGVEVSVGLAKITIKGPKGELMRNIPSEVSVEIKDGKINVSRGLETKKTNALWGTTRAHIANMVKGVKDGFSKQLQLEGIGYRAKVEGGNLTLQLGFSHSVTIEKTAGIDFVVEKNIITVSGPDKELVGQITAKIRAKKPPEPYKGKGVRYVGEKVRKKLGKKAVATSS